MELTAAEAGQRLDRYLRKLLPQLPLTAIYKLLRQGIIRVDGARAQQGLRLLAGMQLELRLPEHDLAGMATVATMPTPGRAMPPALVPRIVHQDEHLLVIDKPAGLAVMPGSGQEHHVTGWLRGSGLGLRTATFAPAPAHRLDRGTSGLLAIGLSPAGLRGLTAAFREDRVVKYYVAMVTGNLSSPRGRIEAPLLVREDAAADEPKVVVAANGLPACTEYEVISRSGRFTRLRLRLYTGRTHQIRAHLRHLGCAIVGDRRYGGEWLRGKDLPSGFCLHAAELQLPHPVHQVILRVHAPIPLYWPT
jgi:23S rRNA pseudouridine955/2504/2580 synthase